MSKAVLVIDMPEGCLDCPFRERIRGGYWGGESICIIQHSLIPCYALEKPQSCPLRPLPEKMQVCGRYPQADGITPSYKIGYNRCLKEIGGEE